METLTITESTILIVLQRSRHGRTLNELMRLTEMSSTAVAEALLELETLGLVKFVTNGNAIYYVWVEPTRPPLYRDFKDWLACFSEDYRWGVKDDVEGTIYAYSDIVLLTAILVGRDTDLIAELNSFPAEFVTTVLEMMDSEKIWSSRRFFDLTRALQDRNVDFFDVESILVGFKEEHWIFSWRPYPGAPLTLFRRCKQVGNGMDYAKQDDNGDDNDGDDPPLGPHWIM